MITLLLLVHATYMYGVVLHAHPVNATPLERLQHRTLTPRRRSTERHQHYPRFMTTGEDRNKANSKNESFAVFESSQFVTTEQ